jgi:hypothetical protein
MTNFLSVADEWLEVAAQRLKDMHPDWTHDRPIRQMTFPLRTRFIPDLYSCVFRNPVQIRVAGMFLQNEQLLKRLSGTRFSGP